MNKKLETIETTLKVLRYSIKTTTTLGSKIALEQELEKKLIQGIEQWRILKEPKLKIVKWVWDNWDKGLKESKDFVDNN